MSAVLASPVRFVVWLKSATLRFVVPVKRIGPILELELTVKLDKSVVPVIVNASIVASIETVSREVPSRYKSNN